MPNPPITVGELNDVPAPQSPVNAQYHQEIAHRVVHRFPTTTAMNAWPAGNGSVAYVTANGLHYRRVAGAWLPVMTGDPHWIPYNPIAPPGNWMFTSSVGKYMRVGDGCFIEYTLTGLPSSGEGGGPTAPLRASLPFPCVGNSLLGSAYVNYSDGVTNAAALVAFSGSSVTPFPVGDAVGNVSNGYTNVYPRPPSGGSPVAVSVLISGWYPIG